MSVRVGVLGAGFIGRVHALNLRRDPRVELVGVADVVPRAAQRLAAEVETAALGSLADLLDRGVDAVYVCTPNVQHVEPVVEALRAGVHVFSEKPMATSLRGAWEIRQAAAQSRGVYQLGFNRRFARVYRFLKGLIADGRLVPLLAQMKHNRGELAQPPWTGDPAVTGGYLYETPVHLFDMGRFLFGEVAEISGVARQSVYNELDGFVMLFRFASGVAASVTSVAHTSWFFPYERVEVYGGGGYDTGTVYDSPGVDHLQGSAVEALLQNPDLPYYVYLTQMEKVKVRGNSPSNTKHIEGDRKSTRLNASHRT